LNESRVSPLAAAPDMRGRGTPPLDTSSLGQGPRAESEARSHARGARLARAQRAKQKEHLTPGRSRTMFSKPLAYPSTLDRRPPVALCAAVAVLRGGVLEPEPHTRAENGRLKPTQIPSVHFPAHDAEGLSLSGGASISTYRLFKLSITS